MGVALNRVRHVFFDMDGTIYHGGALFPTTNPFLEFLRGRGIGYTFLSNNSSYGHAEYVQRLAGFGIEAAEGQFYISTDYAVDFFRRFHPEIRRLHTLGMPCMDRMLEAAGFVIDRERPQAVVVGFDRQLTYDNLCRTAWFLRRGVPGFATHPDVFCPTDQPTCLVDCGAVTACLEAASGVKLKVLGKPDPGMLREAAARVGVPVERTLMIGDRLATDIAVGIGAGAMTCRINGPGADLTPAPGIVPDLEVRDLGKLQAIWEDSLG